MNIKERCLELLESSLAGVPQELNSLDWKERLSPKTVKLAQHLSAFANLPGGGFMVYGINDDASITGVTKTQAETITNKLSNIARDALKPAVQIEALPLNYEGKTILAICIDESAQKPVHLATGSIEDAFIRAGGQTRKMSTNEIRAAIVSTRVQRYEEYPAALPSQNHDSWQELFDFSQILARTGFHGSPDGDAMLEHLYQHKLIMRTKGQYHPTNLCVITCAKDFSKLPGYEKFGIRVTQYAGTNKTASIRDMFFNEGYTLSLDNVVQMVISLLPTNEIIERATRINVPAIPEIAIRELIANAVIHRDFTMNDIGITIDVFHDRVEITNPGGLLPDLSIDRLIDHPSRTRNEVLADFMRKMHFTEERGSGYDKVVSAIEFQGLPPLKCDNSPNYFRTILYAPKPYSDMDKAERIEALYQHSCLNRVMNAKTSNLSVRQRFKFNDNESTKVYRLIKDAVNDGRIRCANPSSAKKEWHYIPYWA